MNEKANDVTMTQPCQRGLTLKDYYEQLPKSSSPKAELLRQIVKRCDVTFQCAFGWIKNGRMPAKKEHCDIVAELTGLPAETLFPRYRAKFMEGHE